MDSVARVFAVLGAFAILAGAAPAPAPSAGNLYTVEFRGPIQSKARQRIEQLGATPLDFIGHHTFLVRVSDAGPLTAVPDVKSVKRFLPAHRNIAVTGHHVRLRLYPDLDPAPIAARLAALGARVETSAKSAHVTLIQVEIPASAVNAVLAWPEVFAAEDVPLYFTQNQNTVPTLQSGIWSNGSADYTIHNAGIRGEGEIVTVMDSGLDNAHAHFAETPSIVGTPGVSHRKVVADDPYCATQQCDTFPCPSGDHGTHVAGTAVGGAEAPNDTSYNGVAPGARLIMQDVQRSGGANCVNAAVYPPAAMSAGPYADARSLGSYIHTNSWNASLNNYGALEHDIDADLWDHKDFLVLFSAGNNGPGFSSIGSPGTSKNVITVGAHDSAPNQDALYFFSSRGPALPDTANRRKPTVTAPGTDTTGSGIWSAGSNGAAGGVHNTTAGGFSGTSMATPAVAGAAALTRQYFREGFYPTGATGSPSLTPSAALLKAVLYNSARNQTRAGQRAPSNFQGYGRVVLDDALYLCGDRDRLFVDDAGRAGTGTRVSHTVRVVDSGQPLTVNLVWTDRPSSNGTLVNDLDLSLSDGVQTWSVGDRLNPDEMIVIEDPAPGLYTVTVTGHSVPWGETSDEQQPFALVARGAIASVDGASLGGVPDPPMLLSPIDNGRGKRSTPLLQFQLADLENNAMSVELQWSTEPDFRPATTITKTIAGPFPTQSIASYQLAPTEAWTEGTWYWRARAIDPGGSHCFGLWSERFSYTLDHSNPLGEGRLDAWHQQTPAQFEKAFVVNGLRPIPAASANASSTQGGVYRCSPDADCSATNVIDGQEGTVWASANPSPEHISVDYERAQAIDQIVLDFAEHSPENTPAKFTLSASTAADCLTSNANYTPLHTEDGTTAARRHELDLTTYARCIRLTITEQLAPHNNDYAVMVGEITALQHTTTEIVSPPIHKPERGAWGRITHAHTGDVTFALEHLDENTARLRATLNGPATLESWTLERHAVPMLPRITGLKANPGNFVHFRLEDPTGVTTIRVQRSPTWELVAESLSAPVLDPKGLVDSTYRLEVELADGTREFYGPVAVTLEDSAGGCACRFTKQEPPRPAIWWLIAGALLFVAIVRVGRIHREHSR